jgi:hypothetical protein
MTYDELLEKAVNGSYVFYIAPNNIDLYECRIMFIKNCKSFAVNGNPKIISEQHVNLKAVVASAPGVHLTFGNIPYDKVFPTYDAAISHNAKCFNYTEHIL